MILAASSLTCIADCHATQEPPPAAEQVQLLLEVFVNGTRSPLWWEFVLLPDGSLATTAGRLRQIGFVLPDASPDAQMIRLNDLPGVTYHYASARQAIEFDAVDAALVPVVLDTGWTPRPIDPAEVTRNTGAVLNYGIYGDGLGDKAVVSAQYDFRLLTRRGVAATGGYAVWSDAANRLDHVRLDTNWRTLDVRHAIELTVGDAISNGGQLGNAYRLGGIQLRRDFDVRPDLVTTALPMLSGSAAVPSTIDLYINGLRYFTGEVRRGPFQFRSLPSFGGGVTATVVLTDVSGRETRINKPLFFVPGLLPRGKLDFSMEAGFPRLNYGVESFDYYRGFTASGSMRYGITDALTLEAHLEGMRGLANGSLGGIARIGGIGSIAAGLAVSRFAGRTGTRYQLYGQTRMLGVNLHAGIERGGAAFENIVTVTTLRTSRGGIDTLPENEPETANRPVLSAFSRRTERVGASFQIFDTGFNLGYTRLRLPGQEVRIGNLSIQRAFGNRISVWGNAYKEFADRKDYGVTVGLSVRLGRRTSASTSISSSRDATRLFTRVSGNTGSGEGSWSWSVADSEILSGPGEGNRWADVRYRAHHTTIGAGVEHSNGSVRANGFVEGSVVLMGGLFFAPSIDRSFAVVRGAGPNTPLFVDTRPVSHTDSQGRALLFSLRSLAENTISIDPRELAVDLKPARTHVTVVPDDRAGVIVDFGVAPEASAVVILVDEAGEPLPIGSLVTLEGGGEVRVVGYDGRTFLTGLSARSHVRVQREGGPDCTAEFDFVPISGRQVVIGPIPCR